MNYFLSVFEVEYVVKNAYAISVVPPSPRNFFIYPHPQTPSPYKSKFWLNDQPSGGNNVKTPPCPFSLSPGN